MSNDIERKVRVGLRTYVYVKFLLHELIADLNPIAPILMYTSFLTCHASMTVRFALWVEESA